MLEFVHNLTQIISGAFDMKAEDFSTRNVAPSLDFNSMSKVELQELQEVLKKAILTSKVNSGLVAILWAVVFAIFIFTVVGPTQGLVIGLILFFLVYERKRHEYWRFFFSFTDHFYKPIKARHLYLSIVSYFAEYGLFFVYIAPFRMFATSREFAKANDGRKMNERRAVYELNLINQLLKK